MEQSWDGNIASNFDDLKLLKKIHGWTTHSRMMSDSPKIKLIAACDKDIKKIKSFKSKWKVSSTYTDFKKMISENKIDILSIATNVKSHYEILIFALNNNVPYIICEKPFVENLEQLVSLRKIFIKSKSIIFVNYRRRWDKNIKNLVNDIKKKKYGQLKHICCHYAGGIKNNGSHLFDLIYQILGMPKNIFFKKYSSRKYKSDLNLEGIMKFNNNITVSINSLEVNYLVFDFIFYFKSFLIECKNNFMDIKIYKTKKNKFFDNTNQLFLFKRINYIKPTNQFKELLKDILAEKSKRRRIALFDDFSEALKIENKVLNSIKKQ